MKNILYILSASALLLFSACDGLRKEVDLNLPDFESKLSIECYLEIGQPFRATLSETTAYFGNLNTQLPIVSGATIIITHNGIADTLEEGFFFGLGKLFNYGSTTIVPADYVNDFSLSVIDSAGRTLTATTKLLQVVTLDSIQVLPPLQDSSYSFLSFFQDNPSETNFYYRTTHRTLAIADSLKTAFSVDDKIVNGQENQIVLGGPPNFIYGDTAVITLFHITESYYDFIESYTASIQNNGNPFAQPGSVVSNVQGGFGIFTGLAYDRNIYYIE